MTARSTVHSGLYANYIYSNRVNICMGIPYCSALNEYSACRVTTGSAAYNSLKNNVHYVLYSSFSFLFVCNIAKHNLCSGKTVCFLFFQKQNHYWTINNGKREAEREKEHTWGGKDWNMWKTGRNICLLTSNKIEYCQTCLTLNSLCLLDAGTAWWISLHKATVCKWIRTWKLHERVSSTMLELLPKRLYCHCSSH